MDETRAGILDGMAEHSRKGEAVAYVGVRDGKLAAVGWRSHRKEKPDFRYRFKTEAEREKFLAEWWEKLDRLHAKREARKARTAARHDAAKAEPRRPNPFKVGDVVTYNLGADGGGCSCYPIFFQVLKVSPRSVVVQEIHHEVVVEDPRGTEIRGVKESKVVARRDLGAFASKAVMKVVKWDREGRAYLGFAWHQSAYLWDGSPKFHACGWD